MLRVIVVGLGPIGVGCARAVLAEPDMKLVGLVDSDPEKVGLSATELTEGQAEHAELPIEQEKIPHVRAGVEELVDREPSLALVTTGSHLVRESDLLASLLHHGMHVVSSCEELAWPWHHHREQAERLDGAARAAERVILGTGVNPGFVMDALPLMLSSMVRRVKRLRCRRWTDASVRRKPFQEKIGATLTPEAFEQRRAEGSIGHVGLVESAAMLASGLGRDIGPANIEQHLEPLLAEEPVSSAVGLIRPGEVRGIHHMVRCQCEDLQIELDLKTGLGITDSQDRITIEGPVQINVKIPGAIPGDSATVAALLNQARNVRRVEAGLRTMLEMPPAGTQNRGR